MTDTSNILVGVLRNRMDKYYYVVCKGLRDTIPKLIGNFLIKASQNDLQFVLFNSVCQSEEIVQKFSESKAIISERDSLEKMIKVLRQAEKKLMSDPNLATSAYRDDSKDIYDTICQKNTEFLSSIKSQHQTNKATQQRNESHLSANANRQNDHSTSNQSPPTNDPYRQRQQSDMNHLQQPQGGYQTNVIPIQARQAPANLNPNPNNYNSNTRQGAQTVVQPNMGGFDSN